MRKKIAFVLLLVIIMTTCIAPVASAATYASDYLAGYRADISVGGNGNVQVNFQVIGTSSANEVGAKKVVIYEATDGWDWRTVKTVTSTSDPNMIVHDHVLLYTVTYNGNPDYYYYAEVTFYAGYNGAGDTRLYTVS